MPDSIPNSWEPDPRRVGNWRAMFEQPRRDGEPPGPAAASAPLREEPADEEGRALDLTEYKPWIIQRARSQPALMLECRKFEPRARIWTGWAMAYHSLYAVEFIGDRMLSLDFGTRQFAIEGHGLDELVRHIQQGTALGVIEYAAELWPGVKASPLVTAIRRVEAPG
ncbi:hypothetical protein [Sphingobium sp. MK2]|uniref:hypothetical protein n=1 Tax=Sphingobium sp. MK2 TaxID=3116540 RepID=UPI0032E36310